MAFPNQAEACRWSIIILRVRVRRDGQARYRWVMALPTLLDQVNKKLQFSSLVYGWVSGAVNTPHGSWPGGAASGCRTRQGCQLQPCIEASTTGDKCSSPGIGDDTCDAVTRAASESRLCEGDAGTAGARRDFHDQVG